MKKGGGALKGTLHKLAASVLKESGEKGEPYDWGKNLLVRVRKGEISFLDKCRISPCRGEVRGCRRQKAEEYFIFYVSDSRFSRKELGIRGRGEDRPGERWKKAIARFQEGQNFFRASEGVCRRKRIKFMAAFAREEGKEDGWLWGEGEAWLKVRALGRVQGGGDRDGAEKGGDGSAQNRPTE